MVNHNPVDEEQRSITGDQFYYQKPSLRTENTRLNRISPDGTGLGCFGLWHTACGLKCLDLTPADPVSDTHTHLDAKSSMLRTVPPGLHPGVNLHQAFFIFFHVFIKSMVSSPLCSNGLYQHTDEGTGKVLYCCREVLVKRVYEAVPCTENEAEDSVRKCPVGQYQPDKTNSSNSPWCFAEPECTDEGIKIVTCIDDYCWPVCICNLKAGKCGDYPSNCLDVRDINCKGKILQDCSCALPDIPTPLPSSPPTRSISTLKPINPDRTAITSSPTDFTKITNKTVVTKDGSDTGAKGNEVGYRIPVIIIGLVILVVSCIIYVCKCCSNRQKEADKESIEMLESNPADTNIGDKVSADSGVYGLSKGSDENLEPGETDSNNVSNGSDMEGGRNINNSFGDDHDAAQGQSSSQVEVHNDSKSRVEPTLAEEEDSFLESDPFLSPSGCADNPRMQDMSQQSEQNCEAGKTNTNNLLTNELDDPDMTHCKWTSGAGTNCHHTDADHRTDPDSTPSLYQLDVQKEPRQREKPIIVDVEMEDSYVENHALLKAVNAINTKLVTSLQVKKKVAVISPFNEGQTVPVAHSPPGENSENQRLWGEGGAAVDSMNWTTLGSSINHDSTN